MKQCEIISNGGTENLMSIDQRTELFKKLLIDIYENVYARNDVEINELVVQIMERLKKIIV